MNNYKIQFITVLILDVVSALSARQAFEAQSLFFILLSMISLATAGYFFIKLMQEEVGILVNITWIALGTINVTVASWIAFGEKVSWLQGFAMAVIVMGLILIEVCAPKDEVALDPAQEDLSAPPRVPLTLVKEELIAEKGDSTAPIEL